MFFSKLIIDSKVIHTLIYIALLKCTCGSEGSQLTGHARMIYLQLTYPKS